MFHLLHKQNELVKLLPEVRGRYKCDEPMSRHTWFGVGGPAEVMYLPEDDDDLSFFMKTRPYNLPICVIGGGSNLLVRDGGIPGVVIKLTGNGIRNKLLLVENAFVNLSDTNLLIEVETRYDVDNNWIISDAFWEKQS